MNVFSGIRLPVKDTSMCQPLLQMQSKYHIKHVQCRN